MDNGRLIGYHAEHRLGMRGIAGGHVYLQQFAMPGEIGPLGWFTTVAPATKFPYLPNTGEGSQYQRDAYWHYYDTKDSYFAAVFPNSWRNPGKTIIQVVHFAGQRRPTVLMDHRRRLYRQGILSMDEIRLLDEQLASLGLRPLAPILIGSVA